MTNRDLRKSTGWNRGRRSLAVAVATSISLLTLSLPAPAQQAQPAVGQQAPASLPAGQIPTEAQVLLSPEQDGFPISIEFVDIDIRDVTRFFGDLTGLNLILDPEVSGPVTMQLTQVPWDIALTTVLERYGLDYEIDRNVVRITTVEKLAAEAQARAQRAEQEQAAAPLATQQVRLSYARASELNDLVTTQLSQRGQSIVDDRTNSIIIKDTAEAIEEIETLIGGLDIPARQVDIKARIVETTRDFSRELGIQWGFNGVADATHGNTTGLVFPNNFQIQGNNLPQSGIPATGIGGTPFAVNLPTQQASSGISLTMGSILDTFRLDVALSAMEEEGRGKVISTPSVNASNNFQATIESGQRIPVQTLVDNTASVTFINANLQLQVTPQITEEGTVMLDIVVDKSEPDFSNVVVGIPTIFTRRATSRVLVRDGGTTVIGGIFQLSVNEASARVPFFHRIPLLGNLFKSNTRNQTNNELLIFITPRIIEQ